MTSISTLPETVLSSPTRKSDGLGSRCDGTHGFHHQSWPAFCMDLCDWRCTCSLSSNDSFTFFFFFTNSFLVPLILHRKGVTYIKALDIAGKTEMGLWDTPSVLMTCGVIHFLKENESFLSLSLCLSVSLSLSLSVSLSLSLSLSRAKLATRKKNNRQHIRRILTMSCTIPVPNDSALISPCRFEPTEYNEKFTDLIMWKEKKRIGDKTGRDGLMGFGSLGSGCHTVARMSK